MLNQNVKDYIQTLDRETLVKCLQARDIAVEFESYMQYENTLLSDSAYVYDIGMSYISHNLKDKSYQLTKCEREFLDLHSYIGYRLLKEMEEDEKICQMILFHHSLTPVSFGDIPECLEEVEKQRKQLFCIDAFIGLTSDRPYRPKYSVYKAHDLIGQTKNKDENFLKFIEERYF